MDCTVYQVGLTRKTRAGFAGEEGFARWAGGLGYGLAAAIGLDGGSQLSLRGERKGLAIALAMTDFFAEV